MQGHSTRRGVVAEVPQEWRTYKYYQIDRFLNGWDCGTSKPKEIHPPDWDGKYFDHIYMKLLQDKLRVLNERLNHTRNESWTEMCKDGNLTREQSQRRY